MPEGTMAPQQKSQLSRSFALAPAQLSRLCDPAALPFQTTEELPDPSTGVGQMRAIAALQTGITIEHAGFNVFAMGPEGLGRHTMVQRLLGERAPSRAVPPDWCYVFNFEKPHQPRALNLPSGRAAKLKRDMAHLVEDLRTGVPLAFETDEYRTRRGEIEAQFNERQSQALGAVEEHARARGVALLRTPAGFGFAPLGANPDEVMGSDDFEKLPPGRQEELRAAMEVLQEELAKVLHQMPKERREAQRRLRELNREVTSAAVRSLMEECKAEYDALPEVRAYLSAVQDDVLDHAEFFQQPKDGETPTLFGVPLRSADDDDSPLNRYSVNVLIEHAGAGAAPIVYEDTPSHDNLVGRIEHVARMGTLFTDFTLIKAGALHRANGGYLILDALKLLTQPFAWDALKRALRSREIRTQSLGQVLSLVSTMSLEPQPIPLDVKVILVGQRFLYYLLHDADPEFGELFKIVADFEEDMPRGPEADLVYSRLIAAMLRADKLRALDRSAVARIIEYGSRACEDSGKLSIRMKDLVDLLRETDHWAAAAKRTVATATDVQSAIDAARQRSGRIRERVQEELLRGTLLVDVAGERVGQVNGLSVVQLGEEPFGMPHRITASVRPGAGKVLDIERETRLGGPIHSKGVLILSGYVSGRYAPKTPLSLAASLVFEQSYGSVEGDSASCAELYALLSALADAPVRQGLAVTGSVNQHGDVQAIGGVNEKIEGFFDVCAARGLNGDQGVLVPASNVKNLMLRSDVIEAVSAGKFHVYAVASVDEGIALLTGMPAGERDALGRFPSGSVNGAVEQRLVEFAERIRAFGGSATAKKERRRGTTRR